MSIRIYFGSARQNAIHTRRWRGGLMFLVKGRMFDGVEVVRSYTSHTLVIDEVREI